MPYPAWQMHMYVVVLFVHSWLRWLVLLAAVIAIGRALRGVARGAAWQALDRRAHVALLHLANLQFALGLLLYVWLSPIVRSAFADLGVAMRSAPLRFFAIEHITAMVMALGVLHVANARRLRATSDAQRQRRALVGSLSFLLLVLAGIPWPGLKHARPLARTLAFETGADDHAVPELYRRRCAACHGATGRGDGVAAAAMQPRPRDFADARWQREVSDRQLERVIAEGGAAHALSASMPPHPDLRAAQLTELVRFVRAAQGRAVPTTGP